ncbi:MAG: Gfo/Idh/MocA family oxidoreductase [Gammaproteobacteria bacterium]|jgi:predicted dehydrogenase|nr:Gfo/Idh/MocA family oxidoreductase [Gammaproteobacteria bacterium]
MAHAVSIIGLGVMGQRMLGSMALNAKFNAVSAWDPDADARDLTHGLYPEIRIADSAEDAISGKDTAVVYIACPPVWHKEHAIAAMEAGKAVYCEKPLGIDVAQSRDLVEQARDAGVVNIVNFSLASAAAVTEVEKRLSGGALGDLAGIDVRVHFSQWPREWQMDAADWLSYREQGGFTREVLSHWIYLTERLFGRAELRSAAARYPGDKLSETHVIAELQAGGLPVSVAGSVGGAGPDLVEYTIWGSSQSCRIVDWNRLFTSNGAEWEPQLTHIDDPRQLGYQLQLDNAAAAVDGASHSMPDFADALSVQMLIEDMLAP